VAAVSGARGKGNDDGERQAGESEQAAASPRASIESPPANAHGAARILAHAPPGGEKNRAHAQSIVAPPAPAQHACRAAQVLGEGAPSSFRVKIQPAKAAS